MRQERKPSAPRCFSGNPGAHSVVPRLIESGINVDDATDEKDNTTLHFAVTNGHIEALHLLLNSGAGDTVLNMDEDALFHIITRCKDMHKLHVFFLQHPVKLLCSDWL